MNIVLIGYRGTGKSEVAKALAEILNMNIVGMDDEIVKRAGLSIPEIVDRGGWTRFRDLESELARQLAQGDQYIIDTGGGVIERSENIEALKSNGLVFWLKASVAVIVSRIAAGNQRPALTAGKSFTEEVEEVLTRRIPKYREAADYAIDTDEKSPARIAAEIAEHWEKKLLNLTKS